MSTERLPNSISKVNIAVHLGKLTEELKREYYIFRILANQ